MKIFIFFSAMLGLSALMMDAFIAHGLESFLGSHYTSIAEHSLSTAARYQLTFSVVLMVLAVFWRHVPSMWIIASQLLLLFGVFFFSGAIYLKHLAMWTSIGFLAPIGGVLLMLAFVALLPLTFIL